MRVVILGPPGAGKGTQCKRIVERYGLLHLSSGDILRQERAAETELGTKAQIYMDSGELVPDGIIVEMMARAISRAPEGNFVLDGFPRTVRQAAQLDKSLAAAGQRIDVVLNLEANRQAIINRITGRRSCPKCGAVYHIKNLKPKVAGLCDRDGAELVQRPDDTEQVVANRLANYYAQTEPVVAYYRQNNTVYDVDSNKSADEVSAELFEKLDSFVQV